MHLESEHRGLMVDRHTPYSDARLTLRDGRTLGYAMWGDPDGRPVLLFHGSPASRLFSPDPALTAAMGVRLITIDRPGYGCSDPTPGRGFLDWPSDVDQLADTLALPPFPIVAHSSGGPYALACASALSRRVSRVALVSSVAPRDELPSHLTTVEDEERQLVELARTDPATAAAKIASGVTWLAENPELFLSFPRPEPDALLLQQGPIREMFTASVREAVRRGLAGYIADEVAERRPWGFRLGEVGQRVSIWHGAQDPYIPPAHAQTVAALLPNSRLHIDAEQGHGLILARWADILDDLTGSWT
jgi:pimeloyl-ACP methyl ester carboxylesterase